VAGMEGGMVAVGTADAASPLRCVTFNLRRNLLPGL
jgi:hypothetical protein